MTFGEKLQGMRKARGWTQEELAGQIGVSRQALSKREQNTAMPDTENVLQISRLFGVSTDYLLHDEYESDNDIPAVRQKGDSMSEIYTGRLCVILGGILSLLSAAGLLIMAIEGSLGTYGISYAMPYGTGDGLIKSGLPAYLEMNNLEWLFNLCIVLFFAGIFIALLPKIRARRK